MQYAGDLATCILAPSASHLAPAVVHVAGVTMDVLPRMQCPPISDHERRQQCYPPSGAGDRAVRPPRCATCWSFSRGDQGLESSSSRLSMTSVAFAVDAMSLSDFACIAVAIPAPPLACTPFWAMPSCSLRVQRAHPAWLNCVLTCISATFGFAPRGRPCVICVALSRDQGGKLFEWLEQEAALSASSHPWLCFTREPNRTWNHRKERKSCTPSVPSTLRYNLGSLNPKPQAQNPKP